MMKTNVSIAILASGGGSNAEKIIQHFKAISNINIVLIVTNKADAYVVERAKNHSISYYVHTKEDAINGKLLNTLLESKVDFIVLAGYLRKIGSDLLTAYPNKIINIHPALLPKFGGQGMYGMYVHRAVVEAKETESGITIHYVNANYDEGAIIEQHKCKVLKTDTAEEVQANVLQLEHKYFASCIERLINQI